MQAPGEAQLPSPSASARALPQLKPYSPSDRFVIPLVTEPQGHVTNEHIQHSECLQSLIESVHNWELMRVRHIHCTNKDLPFKNLRLLKASGGMVPAAPCPCQAVADGTGCVRPWLSRTCSAGAGAASTRGMVLAPDIPSIPEIPPAHAMNRSRVGQDVGSALAAGAARCESSRLAAPAEVAAALHSAELEGRHGSVSSRFSFCYTALGNGVPGSAAEVVAGTTQGLGAAARG